MPAMRVGMIAAMVLRFRGSRRWLTTAEVTAALTATVHPRLIAVRISQAG